MTTVKEEGGKEGGGTRRGEKEEQPEKGPGQKEVKLKQRLLEERQDHHSRFTRRGT